MNLVERLTAELGYPLLTDPGNLEAFVTPLRNSVIFLPAEPQTYPETLDVAIVLPELVKTFQSQLQAAVADNDFARTIAKQYGITSWPALLFLRNGAYLGAISRMRDWDVYVQETQALLQAEPSKAPGIGIPVVSAT